MYGATQQQQQPSPRGRVIPQQRQQQTTQQSGLLKSSLDIVWSYSRSQAYYGSNLPSSPSFVQRYRRPARFSNSDGEASPRGRLADGGELSNATETEEDGEEDEQEYEDDDPEGSTGDDEEEAYSDSQAGSSRWREQQLPWNAVNDMGLPAGPGKKQQRRRSSSRKKRSQIMTASTPIHADRAESPLVLDEPEYFQSTPHRTHGASNATVDTSSSAADATGAGYRTTLPGNDATSERAPLLEKFPGGQALSAPPEDDHIYSSSPPETAPFPRRSPHLKKRRLSEDKKRQRTYVHEGSSTSGQTLFNSINVLVGIGILAQPLAFSQAGWILGVGLLIFYAFLTNYTAKILARVLREDAKCMTYADVGAKAFGPTARKFINALFCMEISALCVALIILLGDSLATLFPLSSTTFKLLGFIALFPTLFLPLRYLSIASLIGIMSVVTLTLTVLIDGSIAKEQPGSLRHPMPTSLGPSWRELPLSFGLIMSGFGGHAVIPSLARDMKKPEDFNRVCDIAFVVSTATYLLMGVVGYLMFGNHVSDEITRDLFNAPSLPHKLNMVAVCMVAITPICKYSISSTPLEHTLHYILGINETPVRVGLQSGSSFTSAGGGGSGSRLSSSQDTERQPGSTLSRRVSAESSSFFSIRSQPLADVKPKTKTSVRQVVKLVTSLVLLAIAIFLPSFDRVMGLLGAFTVFLICAIVPIAANIALHRHTMSKFRVALDIFLLLVSIAMAVIGTVFVFLPKRRVSK